MTPVSGAGPGGATGPVLRRVLGNAGKLLGGRTLNAGVSLGYTAVAARALGLHTFGVLVLIHAFAQLLGDLVKFQSWQTVLQYGAAPLAEGRRADLHRVLRFTVMLDVASGGVGAIVGVAVALAFGPHLGWTAAQAPVAAAYATSVIFMTSAAPLGVLRLLDRFDIMAAQGVSISVVRLAGAAVGYWMHAGLGFFLLVWAAGTLAGFLLLSFGAWRELRRAKLLEGFRWRGPITVGVPGAWRFAWATNANATLGIAFTHLVTLMLGAMLGAGDAALWRVGRQVADAIAKPVRLMIPALYPELVRLHAAGGQQTMWRLARQIALGAGAAGAVVLAISVFAGEPLLRIVMGAGFAAAAGVMTWQVGAAVIDLAALPLEPMVISLGHAGGAVWVRMVVAAAYALILPLLVRRFGMEGAGAGLVAASAAMAAGMFGLLRRRRTSRDHETA